MNVPEAIEFIKKRTNYYAYEELLEKAKQINDIDLQNTLKEIENVNNSIIAFAKTKIKVVNQLSSAFFRKDYVSKEEAIHKYGFESDDNGNIYIPKGEQLYLTWVPKLGNFVDCNVCMCNVLLDSEDDIFELWDFYEKE